jgi:hypothetical protein
MAAFEAIAPQFWDWSSEHGVLEPLTDDVLRALGVTLPEEYVALLRLRNGGSVADPFRAFELPPGTRGDTYAELRSLNGIGPDSASENAYLTTEWEMPAELVLLDGDGHTWIALDYRAGGAPSVVWYDNELDQDIQLAADFRAFVEGLRPEPPL